MCNKEDYKRFKNGRLGILQMSEPFARWLIGHGYVWQDGAKITNDHHKRVVVDLSTRATVRTADLSEKINYVQASKFLSALED